MTTFTNSEGPSGYKEITRGNLTLPTAWLVTLLLLCVNWLQTSEALTLVILALNSTSCSTTVCLIRLKTGCRFSFRADHLLNQALRQPIRHIITCRDFHMRGFEIRDGNHTYVAIGIIARASQMQPFTQRPTDDSISWIRLPSEVDVTWKLSRE